MLRLHVRPRAEVLFEMADGAGDEFVLVGGEGDEWEEADGEEGPSCRWVSSVRGTGWKGEKMGRRWREGKGGGRRRGEVPFCDAVGGPVSTYLGGLSASGVWACL